MGGGMGGYPVCNSRKPGCRGEGELAGPGLPFLCGGGLTESDDLPVCRVPSSVGEGLTVEDAARKTESHPASWRKMDLSLYGNARLGKALEKAPRLGRSVGCCMGLCSQRALHSAAGLGYSCLRMAPAFTQHAFTAGLFGAGHGAGR